MKISTKDLNNGGTSRVHIIIDILYTKNPIVYFRTPNFLSKLLYMFRSSLRTRKKAKLTTWSCAGKRKRCFPDFNCVSTWLNTWNLFSDEMPFNFKGELEASYRISSVISKSSLDWAKTTRLVSKFNVYEIFGKTGSQKKFMTSSWETQSLTAFEAVL